MDCDGVMALPRRAVDEVLPLARERDEREAAMRERYAAGELSYDLNGLREVVEERVMRVAVLGLGEAGEQDRRRSRRGGMHGERLGPGAATRRRRERSECREAVAGADVVFSLNAASVALGVAAEVVNDLRDGALYADLNTAAPRLKLDLAAALPVQFADVALLGVVPSTGLATPALVSGAGAARFAELFQPLGMPVEVVGSRPGEAAGLKLVRSVFMKGMAAAAIESLAAAGAAGAEARVHADIAAVIGEPLLERLLTGSQQHAARRVDEMQAAAAYLEELGVEPHVARAALARLEALR